MKRRPSGANATPMGVYAGNVVTVSVKNPASEKLTCACTTVACPHSSQANSNRKEGKTTPFTKRFVNMQSSRSRSTRCEVKEVKTGNHASLVRLQMLFNTNEGTFLALRASENNPIFFSLSKS